MADDEQDDEEHMPPNPGGLLPLDLVQEVARKSADSTISQKQIDQFATKFARNLGESGGGAILVSRQKVTKVQSGPIPPADELEHYEKVHPGLAERIVAMAEKDQDEFIKSHNRQQKSDNRFRLISFFGGLTALLLILVVGAGLAYLGFENAALGLFGAAGVGTTIGYFVNAHKSGNDKSGDE